MCGNEASSGVQWIPNLGPQKGALFASQKMCCTPIDNGRSVAIRRINCTFRADSEAT